MASLAANYFVSSIRAISASDSALILYAILSDSASTVLRFYNLTLFFNLLLLLCNMEKRFLGLYLFIVPHQAFWYFRFSDSDTNDLYRVKFINKNVLKRVFATELVNFMAKLS